MRYTNEQLAALLNHWLDFIHWRLAWIAETEARAAWFGTYGARGEFDGERLRWIAKAEAILDRLALIGGSVEFRSA